jgi:TRAP-type C4-dicarboxylate transport system permease large subunit
MDAIPAILIFVPIIQPVALKVGIHPVHLGVVVVMTLALGLLTLPYGLCTLTTCAVAGIPVTRILKLLHIMMIAIFVIIILCAMVPEIVLLIPRLLVP